MWKRLRKWLRIAVTAVSLLVCGLLIVLWVRSYTNPDVIDGSPIFGLLIVDRQSFYGIADVVIRRADPSIPYWKSGIDMNSRWGLDFTRSTPVICQFRAPYWFYLTIFATIAALPWIKWRFSLRTLLIVITLFAVFFGAIAILMRG